MEPQLILFAYVVEVMDLSSFCLIILPEYFLRIPALTISAYAGQKLDKYLGYLKVKNELLKLCMKMT